MKGNTKKLAVFVIIAAIAMFIAAAMASADDQNGKAFQGSMPPQAWAAVSGRTRNFLTNLTLLPGCHRLQQLR